MKSLSNQTVCVQEQFSCIVGVDVHKKTYAVTVLRSDGQSKSFVAPADAHALFVTAQRFGGCITQLVHEAGPTGFTLAWACQDSLIPVIVVAPSRVPRPVNAGAKTDRLDSRKLAEYAAKGMLKSIAIPTQEESALRRLERRRQRITRSLRKQKQEIRSFLLEQGITEPQGLESWSKQSIGMLKSMELAPLLRETLDSYLDELVFLQTQKSKLAASVAAAVEASGKKHLVACLKTAPGVGDTIAHTFVTEIFRPERFEHGDQIAAYVGLAPILSQSGQGKVQGRLKPTGQGYLRSILVEGAWHWKNKNARAQALYTRVLSRTGLAAKAIIAVARKLLIILWRLAVEQRPYRVSTG